MRRVACDIIWRYIGNIFVTRGSLVHKFMRMERLTVVVVVLVVVVTAAASGAVRTRKNKLGIPPNLAGDVDVQVL